MVDLKELQKAVIDNKSASESSYLGTEYNLYSGESGDSVTVDNTGKVSINKGV